MTTPPDLGCAVRPDGSLKDASEIEWHFDKDDETPIASASQGSPTVAPPTHPFFSAHAPAILVAGSRRSGRTARPSNRLVDPDNAMASVAGTSSPQSIPRKRKAPQLKPTCRVIRRTVYISGDEGNSTSDYEDHASTMRPAQDEPTDTEEIEDASGNLEYTSLKAMADADHEVSAALI